jgi:ATP-dependent protease HslVU (ClpYQ) peptidase subunit
MSIVACKILPNGFEICSDSIVVHYDHTQSRGNNLDISKLFEVNNIIVGTSGVASETSLIRLFLETHGIAEPTEKGMLEFLDEFSSWKKTKTDNGDICNSYLIGYQGSVFYIGGWSISRVKTYAAIGAGMDYALAALYLGKSAEEAVQTAIELSIYCESPIIKIKKEL